MTFNAASRLLRSASSGSVFFFLRCPMLLMASCSQPAEDPLPVEIREYLSYLDDVSLRWCESYWERSDLSPEEKLQRIENCSYLHLDIGKHAFPRDPKGCYVGLLETSDEWHPLVLSIASCDTPLLAELDDCNVNVRKALHVCVSEVYVRREECLPSEFDDFKDATVNFCEAREEDDGALVDSE